MLCLHYCWHFYIFKDIRGRNNWNLCCRGKSRYVSVWGASHISRGDLLGFIKKNRRSFLSELSLWILIDWLILMVNNFVSLKYFQHTFKYHRLDWTFFQHIFHKLPPLLCVGGGQISQKRLLGGWVFLLLEKVEEAFWRKCFNGAECNLEFKGSVWNI